ncbi:hypothetical protein VTN96DRAFT_139 [Rasamsonia emersonii]
MLKQAFSRSLLRPKPRHSSPRLLPRWRWAGSLPLNSISVTPRRTLHLTMSVNAPATAGNTVVRAREPDDLFRYTSGRWLIDEESQLAQRYVKFNIDNLCRLAASLFSEETKCVRVDKIEGNYNKALLLTMNDGNEVIAKIPCPNAGPPWYTTASEVATLKFLQSCMTIRVPKVLAWSADSENAVGAEYIIMEKIPGVALSERWETMNTMQHYKIIERIVEMEKELGSLEFPAYGSLYLRDSVSDRFRCYPLPPALDPDGLFCIGPALKRGLEREGSNMSLDMGPWTSLTDFALSIPRRELNFVANSPAEIQRDLNLFSENQSVDEYRALLEKASSILPAVSRHPRVAEVSGPVLWHTDLHLGNIFVSSDDPTIIEGIIDWQSSRLYPLFIQARFPDFLRPPKDYTPGTQVPTLPENFDELSPEQQEEAKTNQELATRSKYYEMLTLGNNRHVYHAMELDRRLWEPFTCCQLFFNGSMVPLRSSLIRISEDWAGLGLAGDCPFAFTKEELEKHKEQMPEYEDRVILWDVAKSQLCTDDAGWVPVERWEITSKRNKELFDMFVESLGQEGVSPEVATKKWPFPPGV